MTDKEMMQVLLDGKVVKHKHGGERRLNDQGGIIYCTNDAVADFPAYPRDWLIIEPMVTKYHFAYLNTDKQTPIQITASRYEDEHDLKMSNIMVNYIWIVRLPDTEKLMRKDDR